MNVIKKIYCRIYQTAFHAALPFLPYREPEILKSVQDIACKIKAIGKGSSIIITDKFLMGSPSLVSLVKALKAKNIKFTVYDKTRPNPTVLNVEEALVMYKLENCDCIIAFGGGSSIDLAKALGARVSYPEKSLDKLGGTLKVLRRLPPLFAVPTTAGTGSETTLAAVITDSEKKYKYTINSFPLIPRYAVLDPKVTYSLPEDLTATTGMDAMTHAVEAYIGRSTSC